MGRRTNLRPGCAIAALVSLIAVTSSQTAHAAGGLWVQLGGEGAELSRRLPADGNLLELPAPPVYDGLAAAHGRLYIATSDGRLLCFEGK